MMVDVVPQSQQDLLKDETKAFAFLGTLMADGSPQVTPIWFITDGAHILINSAEGRVKDRNMRKDPRVAITLVDPSNPYRYVQIRGRVVEMTQKDADEVIDHLSLKYTGNPKYQGRMPGEVRVTYKILPEKASKMG
jgi:PPOX class probable F420-dependent enzyme